MKSMIVPLSLGFGVALALIVGEHMTMDALAVVIGTAVGVAASIPATLLLIAMLRRERRQMQRPPELPRVTVIRRPPAELLPPSWEYEDERRERR